MSVLLVFLGGGLGSLARYGVNMAAVKMFGPAFPWGTLTVNVVGSLLMGLLTGWLLHRSGTAWAAEIRLFLATGVLGGFTTFSAFSLDAVALWERGDIAACVAYVAASVALSLLAVGLGLWLTKGVG